MDGENFICLRTIKRKRITKAEKDELMGAIMAELIAEHPQTVRHVFYCLCHLDTVGKTESGYRRIQRLILTLRKTGEMPYSWISDGTRYRIKPNTFDSIADAIEETAMFYRRALWRDSGVYVEVWCESDSIAGVLQPVTEKYDVSLMSSRGFSSHTFLHQAATEMSYIGKPAYIYYVGDYDPSGKLIGDHILRQLREFAPDTHIEFERLLINRDQIDEYDLPTKPVKKNSHAGKFDDTRTVEAEAMPAGQTREILEKAILRHIEPAEIEVIEVAEKDERRAFEMFREDWMYENGETLQ
ncbi:MAG: hypothetical protein O7G31_06615 [Calditrichaeota bacterium]|nr:hypothetical protein [Calditrichota bacterium]